MNTEERSHTERLLEINRTRMHELEVKVARYGELETPAHIAIELRGLRATGRCAAFVCYLYNMYSKKQPPMPYTTITTEGGLLPADVPDAVASADLPGQRPEDFGLERGRNLSDRIAASWQAARGH